MFVSSIFPIKAALSIMVMCVAAVMGMKVVSVLLVVVTGIILALGNMLVVIGGCYLFGVKVSAGVIDGDRGDIGSLRDGDAGDSDGV